MQIVVLIPAYKPTSSILALVKEICHFAYHVLIVDDGSGAKYAEIFSQLSKNKKVSVITHAINLGKGQALKTGFNTFLTQFANDCLGIVTADADGQHLSQDIQKLAQQLIIHPTCLCLGARNFDTKVPLRSQLGNTLTRYMFYSLIHKKITDTQTGLRGIPKNFLHNCLHTQTNGYDFELDMLIKASQLGLPIKEISITTIYEKNNASSHFNPLIDSIKIYFVFFRFLIAAIASGILHLIIFYITLETFGLVFISQVFSRIFSGTFNFTCNRIVVFRTRKKIRIEALKYTLLSLVNLIFSYYLISGFLLLGINVYVSETLILFGLFIANFSIQKLLIFNAHDNLSTPDKEQ